jgi:hypothetical protein
MHVLRSTADELERFTVAHGEELDDVVVAFARQMAPGHAGGDAVPLGTQLLTPAALAVRWPRYDGPPPALLEARRGELAGHPGGDVLSLLVVPEPPDPVGPDVDILRVSPASPSSHSTWRLVLDGRRVLELEPCGPTLVEAAGCLGVVFPTAAISAAPAGLRVTAGGVSIVPARVVAVVTGADLGRAAVALPGLLLPDQLELVVDVRGPEEPAAIADPLGVVLTAAVERTLLGTLGELTVGEAHRPDLAAAALAAAAPLVRRIAGRDPELLVDTTAGLVELSAPLAPGNATRAALGLVSEFLVRITVHLSHPPLPGLHGRSPLMNRPPSSPPSWRAAAGGLIAVALLVWLAVDVAVLHDSSVLLALRSSAGYAIGRQLGRYTGRASTLTQAAVVLVGADLQALLGHGTLGHRVVPVALFLAFGTAAAVVFASSAAPVAWTSTLVFQTFAPLVALVMVGAGLLALVGLASAAVAPHLATGMLPLGFAYAATVLGRRWTRGALVALVAQCAWWATFEVLLWSGLLEPMTGVAARVGGAIMFAIGCDLGGELEQWRRERRRTLAGVISVEHLRTLEWLLACFVVAFAATAATWLGGAPSWRQTVTGAALLLLVVGAEAPQR